MTVDEDVLFEQMVAKYGERWTIRRILQPVQQDRSSINECSNSPLI